MDRLPSVHMASYTKLLSYVVSMLAVFQVLNFKNYKINETLNFKLKLLY